MTRQMLGGSAEAAHGDPDWSASRSAELGAMFELMKSDHDSAQGADHWKTVVAQTFDRITQPHGYTLDDLPAITAPTLILTGDRDPFCPVKEGAEVCDALQAGHLAALPDTAHLVSRKWSGKTLAGHRADRKNWLLVTLGKTATDPARYAWEPVAPGDPTTWNTPGASCTSSPTASTGKPR